MIDASWVQDVAIPVITALGGAIGGGGSIWVYLGKHLNKVEERQKRQNMALRWILLWIMEDDRASRLAHPDVPRRDLDPEQLIKMLDL